AEAVGADADAAAADADAEPPLPAEPLPPPPPIVVVAPRPKPPKPPKPKKKQSELPFEEYPFPPIELFQEPQHGDLGATSDVLNKGGQAIVQKLANFDIQSEIVAASVGPAVTQYELRLHEGIRVNKVATFESDLAAALKAVSVRVVAPIPGKDTIGIEVPNVERQKVYMRDLLDQFGRSESAAIPLYLGKDVAGNPIVEDMARMPHLLIAGTTGSGKSVCINTILLSILMTRTPEQVKLILVDPKMVELQAYKRVPHLCCDVVTNMKKAPSVLQWAVDEMENRYALLSAAGVNHIRNYNRLGATELEKRLKREPDPERVLLPYIVIVIDEFADLMNVAQNEVEELIQRLAQKSRAVGMHVILATQRPSSEVITGIIKANLPCQIAFKVNRRIDSRVILDANGAEKLLGFGDMLYMPPGGGALIRAQGTFVADDEMQAVVRFLEEHGQEPQFDHALMQTQTGSRKSIADRDERYREAVEIVLGQQRGSATLLQRALAVGYTRATRLLHLLFAGVVLVERHQHVARLRPDERADQAVLLHQLEQAMAELEQAEADGETDGETAADAAPIACGSLLLSVDSWGVVWWRRTTSVCPGGADDREHAGLARTGSIVAHRRGVAVAIPADGDRGLLPVVAAVLPHALRQHGGAHAAAGAGCRGLPHLRPGAVVPVLPAGRHLELDLALHGPARTPVVAPRATVGDGGPARRVLEPRRRRGGPGGAEGGARCLDRRATGRCAAVLPVPRVRAAGDDRLDAAGDRLLLQRGLRSPAAVAAGRARR
ncbi:MAG: DNA translocase FtsK, partial [Planctomycetes bacterium]|nr:DNA translocase FtsK [Planctomycetota bacterium]